MPPSLLASPFLSQAYGWVNDAEVSVPGAAGDNSWKMALGIDLEDWPFSSGTLQAFRTKLGLPGTVREVFESRLHFARESGRLKRRRMYRAVLPGLIMWTERRGSGQYGHLSLLRPHLR